jgi:cytoskeleton protein RodZ
VRVTTAEVHSEAASEPPVSGPGARLKAARETAGLSLDQAAQQLKLAPRQVRALEDEDFAHLPGRTFTRGFVRNYARLLNLDPEDLLALMPNAAEAPSLEAPALQPTRVKIAELPRANNDGPGLARWLIPLVLVACVVAAAAYEWYASNAAAPGEAARPALAKSEALGDAGTPTREPPPSAAQPVAAAPAPPESEPAPATEAPAQVAAPPAAASPTEPIAPPAPASTAAGAAPLLLTYAGPSWTEIRDREGMLLVSRLVPAGSEQAVRGAAPFDVVIGNANSVTLVYRGNAIDLSRYTRQNVARLRLP